MKGNRMRTLALLTAAVIVPVNAQALFHEMKIREVYAGSVVHPSSRYVMLQMYSANQTNLLTHEVTVFDASGALVQTSTFGGPVANGTNQATILVGTSDVTAEFGVVPDLVMAGAVLSAAGGKACFDAIPADCVAWGNYSGDPTGVGTPVAPAGIPSGKAIRRDISAGNASLLQATDDTGDSAADFDPVDPAPQNNAGTTGTTTTTQPGGSTTTTSTTPGGSSTTSTTTTLPCPPAGIDGARCVLGAIPPPACTNQTTPAKIMRNVTVADTLLGKAQGLLGARRGQRLLKKAAAKLAKAGRMTAKAGDKGRLTAECATGLGGAIEDARNRALANP